MTWTLISHGKPISDIGVLLGLPENAELQLQSTPGNSQGEMEEKVGFVTVFGNDYPLDIARVLASARAFLHLGAGRIILISFTNQFHM